MRVSKLEPHVLGGLPDDDLINVIESINENSNDVSQLESATDENNLDSSRLHQQNLNDTIVRLADYLKHRKGQSRSKKAMAFRHYIWQRDLLVNASNHKSLKV